MWLYFYVQKEVSMCKPGKSYRCKHCGKLFRATAALNDAYLIEHLLRNHPSQLDKTLTLEKLIEKSYREIGKRRINL